jgi:diaminohydroxyphosphoribosylaminopyrimidine deaminase / 5-amino-6-(5-phosphoribosylamino)uracil reductase
MNAHERYMKRCLKLALKGMGNVAPNPMVGCVIVHDGKIIGEGYHRQYGTAHAEANAVKKVKNKRLLRNAALYVNLEPCAHVGKTPPCADLILRHRIPRVVIGCMDSNPKVKGEGIKRLREQGVEVTVGVLEQECRSLNKRFFTFFEKKRPYIILKWAQTADGFMDQVRTPGTQGPLQVSSTASKKRTHQWRSEEQGILVGTATALLDDPQLNVRRVGGKNPVRMVIDKDLVVPGHARLLDGKQPTLVFTAKKQNDRHNIHYVKIPFNGEMAALGPLLNRLYERRIISLIIEGGGQLLNSFIAEGLWDEARVFVSKKKIGNGVKAPALEVPWSRTFRSGPDQVFFYPSKKNKFAV